MLVSLGLSSRGVGAARFAPAKTKIDAATYMDIVENTYLPEAMDMYGVPPTCVFQRDGASPHAAKVAQAFCAAKFPKFWAKGVWPPNSPDINVLDFFAREHLQTEVGKKKPQCLESLKVAIRQAVLDMPLDMVQRACRSFGKRVRLCIQAEGGSFKGKKLAAKDEPLLDNEVRNEGDEDGESDDEGSEP